MLTSDFDYNLPPELIAQTPLPRGESRLLTLHRETGNIGHKSFRDILDYLNPGDLCILNDTRVSARRYHARKSGGGTAEAFLLHPIGATQWKSLVRPGGRLKPGSSFELDFGDQWVTVNIDSSTSDGGRILTFPNSEISTLAGMRGVTPLPPYISAHLQDEERYQTVYGTSSGSAAAPTAGLHFDNELLDAMRHRNIGIATVTLHVGLDTFRPVKVDTLDQHVMHGESYHIPQETVDAVANSQGRIVCIGTTSVRACESAAFGLRQLKPGASDTQLFITPGYQFKIADGILTNFHLPQSTLIMMVSAFAGMGNIKRAYSEAIDQRYRFFSFGDAMLII